jgi:hypothetical protein
MNDQEANVCIQCPPHLTFVVALPGESLSNEFVSQHIKFSQYQRKMITENNP